MTTCALCGGDVPSEQLSTVDHDLYCGACSHIMGGQGRTAASIESAGWGWLLLGIGAVGAVACVLWPEVMLMSVACCIGFVAGTTWTGKERA